MVAAVVIGVALGILLGVLLLVAVLAFKRYSFMMAVWSIDGLFVTNACSLGSLTYKSNMTINIAFLSDAVGCLTTNLGL